MIKKSLALMLTLTMLLTLIACGGSKTDDTNSKDDVAEEPPAQATQNNTPENTDHADSTPSDPEDEQQDTNDNPAEDAVGTESLPAEPSKKPEADNTPAAPVQKPAESPTSKPTETPVDPPETKPEVPSESSVDLAAFGESLTKISEWPAMGSMEAEALDAFYPGLSAIAVHQCHVSMAMMGATVAEIALVEVQNVADVDTVKAIFQARIHYQVGDETNPGGAWYPESIEGWKNNSRVVSNGNYVMMVAHSSADDAVAAFNALFS